jgi:hypothetical protein
VIPSSVTVLGRENFCWCESLEYVVFESGSRLERIEERAFFRSGLRSIVIPLSVVVLGKGSFDSCYSLESVIFESGSRLERIEESAFEYSGLHSIDIPPGVMFIDGSAFAAISLISVSVSPANGKFRLRELLLEDFDGSTIYRYFGACSSVLIPSSIVVLGRESFSWCESLTSVIFESGSRLERIEGRAFHRSGLRSIVIPSSVVVLGKESFYWCLSLKSVLFESGSRLERIEERAFHVTSLGRIEIPPGVRWDSHAF